MTLRAGKPSLSKSDTFFPFFSRFKTELVTTVQNEENAIVRKRACQVTALLASKLLNGDAPGDDWKDFPEFLFTWSYSASTTLRQASLDIFAAAPGMFGPQPIPDPFQQLTRQLLVQGLTDPVVDVKTAALGAVFSYINHGHDHATVRGFFTELLPWILRILVNSLGTVDGDVVTACFLDLKGVYPEVLAIHREAVRRFCLEVAATPHVPDVQRSRIVEIARGLSSQGPDAGEV